MRITQVVNKSTQFLIERSDALAHVIKGFISSRTQFLQPGLRLFDPLQHIVYAGSDVFQMFRNFSHVQVQGHFSAQFIRHLKSPLPLLHKKKASLMADLTVLIYLILGLK